MTQPIIPDPPEFGSVAMFAHLLRVGTETPAEVNRRAVAAMSIAIGHASTSDRERVEHIRNLLTAVEMVRSEVRQVACSDECQAQPEERPCLDSCPAQRAARGES